MAKLRMLENVRAGAARNALDCAFFDLECKLRSCRIWQLEEVNVALFGSAACPHSDEKDTHEIATAVTVSIDTPEQMSAETRKRIQLGASVLKVKVGGTNVQSQSIERQVCTCINHDEIDQLDNDVIKVRSVRQAAGPNVILFVDANEGWSLARLPRMLHAMKELRVEVVEQPLPAESDDCLRSIQSDTSEKQILICADESLHTRKSMPAVIGKYDVVNIKLDKTGGLTEALKLYTAIREYNSKNCQHQLKVMIGCMVCSSLSIAPALSTIARVADYVDLDGPALLKKDCDHGVKYTNGGGTINHFFSETLWG